MMNPTEYRLQCQFQIVFSPPLEYQPEERFQTTVDYERAHSRTQVKHSPIDLYLQLL